VVCEDRRESRDPSMRHTEPVLVMYVCVQCKSKQCCTDESELAPCQLQLQRAQCITWKESLAGERGAMGLSVLQKWMVEGRGLGVSSTGVWTNRHTTSHHNINTKTGQQLRGHHVNL